jgi:hypothetical protein
MHNSAPPASLKSIVARPAGSSIRLRPAYTEPRSWAGVNLQLKSPHILLRIEYGWKALQRERMFCLQKPGFTVGLRVIWHFGPGRRNNGRERAPAGCRRSRWRNQRSRCGVTGSRPVVPVYRRVPRGYNQVDAFRFHGACEHRFEEMAPWTVRGDDHGRGREAVRIKHIRPHGGVDGTPTMQ